MKTTNAFKKKILYLLLLFSISPGLFQSCYTEDVVDNYFTFTGELIGDYIDNRPERFSEFKRLLDTTGVMGLLKAYGLYTCFLPTNDAMQKYYQDHEKNGAEDFSLAELKTICYNHIIKGDTLATMQFSEGALSSMSMSGRFISVDFSDTTATIFMNGTSPIIEKDIILHNGVVHVLSKAMEPSQDRVSSKLMQDPKFSLFAKAFELTGYRFIMDEAPIEDLTYDPKNYTPSGFRHTVPEELPKYRKFGYTILAESDSTLANYTDCPKLPNGVKTLEDLYTLAEYFYSSKPGNIGLFSDGDEVKDDFTDKRNYLNRYIAYHCMTRTLLSSRFIKDYDTPHHFKIYDMYEYIETMLENRLLEVKIDRNYSAPNSEFGFFNCKMAADGKEDASTGILLTDYKDNDAVNGYYHEIDKPLAYTREFEAALSAKRLRIEAACFFDELATNNMRGNAKWNPNGSNHGEPDKTHAYQIPFGYMDRFFCTESTKFTYIGACSAYEDFQGDEMYARDSYNFTMQTLPIPAGTYEVRMGYQPTAYRGIAQVYWDSIPTGIPVNFSLLASNPDIGHKVPGSEADDPYGYENDKMMRNRGYMKGPDSYKCPVNIYSYSAANARYSTYNLRYILGTYEFKEPAKHYITIVFLGTESGDSQFMMDYLEFCPTELILTEDTH
jgi:uncharacterized surface protein with fasciclin (FAS1) repeats